MEAKGHPDHGAFSKWAKPEFLPDLIPIIPPGATLSANSKVAPNMLGKVPGEYLGDDQWCGFRGFTQHTATEADIATWSAPTPGALIFSNATLQWIGEHEKLFPHLLRQLAPGGVLAVQMPRNFGQDSHRLMRETATQGAWAERLAPVLGSATVLRREPVMPPEAYYDLLAPQAADLDLWETDYLHVLSGEDAVLDWVRGTALRPVLEALAADQRAAFVAAYGARLRQAYPRRGDGKTLFPFRRLFLVARLG